MTDVLDLMRERHSARVMYDSHRQVTKQQLEQVLEAAAWAPTAHNMQNFEVVVADDPAILQAIGAIETTTSAVFLRENYQQLSFSEEELRRKKTGLIASMFPPTWRTPNADFDVVAATAEPAPLSYSLQNCPCLLLVLFDPRKRAPASAGDLLGFMSLGCVMENMWLMAQSLGLGVQILSVLSGGPVEVELQRILNFPSHLKIAYGCRLGHPAANHDYVRVRRAYHEFVHHNEYGTRGLG